MEDFFYPGYWDARPARSRAAAPSMAKPSRPAKVVSVPVHFVSSDDTNQRRSGAAVPVSRATTERMAPATAALAIQRAFRGFLVRKNMRTVRRIEAEVDVVEREVAQAVDRLRNDARERLRLNETLMALLFRLDSVRGVREYRRRVIRRAIALQEAVDATATVVDPKGGVAAARGDVEEVPEVNAPNETTEAQEAATPADTPSSEDYVLQTVERVNEEPCVRDEDGEEEEEEKKVDDEDSACGEVFSVKSNEQEEGEGAANVTVEEFDDLSQKEEAVCENPEGEADDPEGEASEDCLADDPEGEASEDCLADDPEGETAKTSRPLSKCNLDLDQGDGGVETGLCPPAEEEKRSSLPASSAQSPDAAESPAAAQQCGDAAMRLAMDKMVEENRGLKGLLAKLYDRNEMQLRLMDGLLQRVEWLENVVEKMGSGKQRKQGARKCCARKCDRRG